MIVLTQTKILQAKSRIFISTLYVGKEERELVWYLGRALARRPELQLTVLMDAMRATRETLPEISGASLFAPLAAMFPNQVDIRLYATPMLRPNSFASKMLGKRFNEGFGLQHMKIYGFDDDVIISGANLSRDYFMRRKDRYMVIREHGLLSDYLHSLILLVCRFSYDLQYAGDMKQVAYMRTHYDEIDDASQEMAQLCRNPFSLVWDGGRNLLGAEDADGTVAFMGITSSSKSFPERNWAPLATSAVQDFTTRWYERTRDLALAPRRHQPPQDTNTYMVPLLQMGQLKINQETDMIPYMTQFLAAMKLRAPSVNAQLYSTVDLTSGYFGLSGLYKSLILSDVLHKERPGHAPVSFRLVAAAPESNGFFGSKGISRRIPAAYTQLEKEFWDEVVQRNLHIPLFEKFSEDTLFADESEKFVPRVELREWRKYGWTYHEKGSC